MATCVLAVRQHVLWVTVMPATKQSYTVFRLQGTRFPLRVLQPMSTHSLSARMHNHWRRLLARARMPASPADLEVGEVAWAGRAPAFHAWPFAPSLEFLSCLPVYTTAFNDCVVVAVSHEQTVHVGCRLSSPPPDAAPNWRSRPACAHCLIAHWERPEI